MSNDPAARLRIIAGYEQTVTTKIHLLTKWVSGCIMYSNLILQTAEAEITAMMPLQRACGAESQVRNKLSNGPLRVQSKVYIYLHPVFCNVWAYVSCRGYVGILLTPQRI